MALNISGKVLTAEELARKMKLFWRTNPFLKQLIQNEIIQKYAEEQGITVSLEELQEGADRIRMGQGLYSVDDTEQWLAANEMTLDDFEDGIRLAKLHDKVRSLWPEEAVGKYFAENRADLDRAEIYVLVTEDEAAARELKAQVTEEGADFMALAREHSSHPNAKAGGYVGMVQRPALAGEVAAAVFGAGPGEVVGPFKTAEGFTLVQVADLQAAVLNAETEQSVRNLLYESWLQEQEQKLDINWAV